MESFLEADWVINSRSTIGFIKLYNWKHTDTHELYYPVRFYSYQNKATISFDVYIQGQILCITKRTLEVIARRHNLDVSCIFESCSLSS